VARQEPCSPSREAVRRGTIIQMLVFRTAAPARRFGRSSKANLKARATRPFVFSHGFFPSLTASRPESCRRKNVDVILAAAERVPATSVRRNFPDRRRGINSSFAVGTGRDWPRAGKRCLANRHRHWLGLSVFRRPFQREVFQRFIKPENGGIFDGRLGLVSWEAQYDVLRSKRPFTERGF